MADDRSPQYWSGAQTGHAGTARGYANALKSVYDIRPITLAMQTLLERLETAERDQLTKRIT